MALTVPFEGFTDIGTSSNNRVFVGIKVEERRTLAAWTGSIRPLLAHSCGRWDKIRMHRNPANGYRLFRRTDLDKFLAKVVSQRRIKEPNVGIAVSSWASNQATGAFR